MKTKPLYCLDSEGRFVIEDYNHTQAFSNFFPGVAGVWGIPMWVFYVNRGQCISSFGIESKDKSILEFQAANKAYQLTARQGFRTFLKIQKGRQTIFYEPFQNSLAKHHFKTAQRMLISSHNLIIEDINHTLGLMTKVEYFTLPEEPFAALIRRVTLTNIGRNSCQCEVIDGLPIIVPYGLNNVLLKNIPRTVEAWVEINNLKNKAPYYHLKVEVNDDPQVIPIPEGHFYFSLDPKKTKSKLFEPIVDPGCVFGHCSDFGFPEVFVKQKKFKIPREQRVRNQTPCAMSHVSCTLKPKDKQEILSSCGYASDEKYLNKIVKKLSDGKFIHKKSQRNQEIIDHIKNFALTHSSSEEFDLYAQQTFLDNVLRGGLPVSVKTGEDVTSFHVYSRKHGDPERDYNYFTLSPTYFSQGNGNYRDVNQNRRNDIWFNTDVQEGNIRNLLNLIQPDGYNPLVIKGTCFAVQDAHKIKQIMKACVKTDPSGKLKSLLKQGFQPGHLLQVVENGEVALKVSSIKFLEQVLQSCHKREEADHGEGFWADHWTYNLDLIESYLSLYPERLSDLFLKKKDFTFYHNSSYILPRDQRYVLTERGVRQYHSVYKDPEIKVEEGRHLLRTNHGKGDVYQTHLLAKLLCLIANKVASLDPSGVGIEMEADKPNWYDALNGLPGLLGSSISETFELKRLACFVLEAFQKLELSDGQKIEIFGELVDFILELSHILNLKLESFSYWQKSNELKEYYRLSVRLGLHGHEKVITVEQIKNFLKRVVSKTNQGIDRAKVKEGLYSTYFIHDVVKHQTLRERSEKGAYIRPLKFKRHALPLFLEGPVHALRVEKDLSKSQKMYQAVKKSSLFDKKLKMYKVNTDLSKESEEIGRTRIFPSGWLENESIWLHMEYKFLLEVLRCGLYEQFYQDFRNVLIPFLPPQQYGRSILENSSFIVSSAHKDSPLHGQGFVARLSGSTAEFIHIWLLMNLGPEPFFLDEQGNPSLRFRPALPGWLFTKKKKSLSFFDKQEKQRDIVLPAQTYAFKLLGSTLVVYHNPKRKNTFGKNRAQVKNIHLTYENKKKPQILNHTTIGSPIVDDIRMRKVDRIDVFFE